MDSITLVAEGLRVVLGFLNLLFVPGFVLSLVLFPRFTDMGVIQRLAYSTVLSISSVISLVLFMDVVLGVDTTPQNISLGLGMFSALMLLVWLCEIWYLSSTLPARVHEKVSGRYLSFRKYVSRIINARRDRFTPTALTRVLRHESIASDRNHVEHSYLIDVSEELDIHQVDETKWKIAEGALLPPPYPRTRYFELVINEFREEGQSLIDDLNVYPVTVAKKPDTSRGRRSIPKITGRIYEKTDTAEIQWIYSHDFHLFAILHSEDTLRQMVDRVLVKLEEIASSVRSGSRISSHIEETQKLRDEFEIGPERPRRVPAPRKVPAGHAAPQDPCPDRERPEEAHCGYHPGSPCPSCNTGELPQLRPDDRGYQDSGKGGR